MRHPPPPSARALAIGALALAAAPAWLSAQTPAAAPPASPPPPAADAPVLTSDILAGLEARNIGAAVMSGRITDVAAVHEKDRLTVYVGAASGGLWKSTNGGTTFKPVFDRHTQSIGAIAVDPSNPKTVWVGTGEPWTRNSVSVGDGVYRSTDGGESWTRLGLEATERIAAVRVSRADPNTVYVCALGPMWNDHPERGVYRTTDAGKTWAKVLHVNAGTGCASLDVDPTDPAVVYAAMWQYRRTPHSFTSGLGGSGVYKSTDGGTTWTRLAGGLPARIGRVGLAVSPADAKRVYASVEGDEQHRGVWRSDDAGATWTRTSNAEAVIGRPFYFARIVPDPVDRDRVYKPDFGISVSEDGGKSFAPLSGGIHGDVHALWIDPKNTDRLYLGDDGGLYVSQDRGAHFAHALNLPISQFYHVSVDMARPYNVYGGLQDNATWYAPSSWPGGVRNGQWQRLFNGDGFHAHVDPTDTSYVYVEYQGGKLGRVHKRTLESRWIAPAAAAGDAKLRFNWNTPIHMSRANPGTVYVGAQHLYRTRDQGASWERVSPDLTTNDARKQQQEQSGGLTVDNSDAEQHTTIFTIAESPKDARVLWAGTDDGNLQVTRDGGRTWTNVAANVRGVPRGTWVSHVEASPHDAGTAFATFDGHMSGDMRTYVARTTDHGRSWTLLAAPELRGFAHVVRQDPVNPELLFLGTEHGLWISNDAGAHWAQYAAGDFPAAVPVRDLAIHPRDHDLVVATHGRGIWIVDDLTPLRALTPAVLAQEVAFLPTRPQVQVLPAEDGWAAGNGEFVGRPSRDAAQVAYYLKRRHLVGDMRLDVLDSAGAVIATIPPGKRRGINRAEWAQRLVAPKVAAAAGIVPNFYSFVGPRVLDGTYRLRLTKGDATHDGQLTLVADPRGTHTREDRELRYRTARRLTELLGRMTTLADGIVAARGQARERAGQLPAGDATRRQLESLATSLEQLRGRLVATREGGGITGELRIREQLGDLYGNVNSYEGRPTRSQLDRMQALERELAAVEADYAAVGQRRISALNQELERRRLPPLGLRAAVGDAER